LLCFYHSHPTLILFTPGVRFMVNLKSVSQLSVDNSNSVVCLFVCTMPVYYTWVTGSMNTRSVDSGRQLAPAGYTRGAHNAVRPRHYFLSRKMHVKDYRYSVIFMHMRLILNSVSKGFFKQRRPLTE
jgi:hypothetical protein